jgi:hypothetical protein
MRGAIKLRHAGDRWGRSLLLVIALFTSMASVAGDNEALKLELSRQLKQDMSRTSAPFAAVSTTVDFVSNLGLAIQTQKRLDSKSKLIRGQSLLSIVSGLGENLPVSIISSDPFFLFSIITALRLERCARLGKRFATV